MQPEPSIEDLEFRTAFEAGRIAPVDFHHRDHLRLAFVCLCEDDIDSAHTRVKAAIQRFLSDHGVSPEKYHETLTRAWLQTVSHFMEQSEASSSFDDFIAQSAQLLDTDIMFTHYSKDYLFSARARQEYIEPDLQAIPKY